MDDEYETQREGAWYYDPISPVIWKQYIVGPVPGYFGGSFRRRIQRCFWCRYDGTRNERWSS